MTYAVYLNFVNRVARYHQTGCPRISVGNRRSGQWRHGCIDLETVFIQGMQAGIKAVITADCCLPDNTEARCVGCVDK